MKFIRLLSVALITTFLLAVQPLSAQSLEAFEDRVTEFTLDNGLHFIIIQRDVAPVASFVTFVNVGAVNEPVGQTGITHIFEHMAFKGSSTIGTTNFEAELPLIEAMDDAYRAWLQESTRANPDEEKMEEHWAEFERLQDASQEYVVNNEFSMIVDREGAVGMNAYVGADETAFFYSLPQNKAELWFRMEADRFMNPVMREFYLEKNVIWEERRDRTDNNPIGRLIEEFNSVAFSAHPYKNPAVGWPSDIDAVTIRETLQFYENYYVPQNMTISIAGDVDPAEMKRLAEKYFGGMPAAADSPQLTVVEPPQRGERRFTIEDQSQPILMIGYKSVSSNHVDAPAIELLASILFAGRTSRIYRSLVVEEQLALQLTGFNGFPGDRFPGLFVILGVPNQGVELDLIETRIYEEIERIQSGDVTETELDRVRTQARASNIRGLTSNMNLALGFARTHARTNDWRTTFTDIEKLNEVTTEDIQRVAQKYLVPTSRTVGSIVTKEEPTASTDN